MARMIPHAITKEMKNKLNVSQGEMDVFDLLSQFPDEYVCVWNVIWGQQSDFYWVGEIDFILLHPKYPMTVLEVKGGLLSCEYGRWKERHDGRDEFIYSPVNQASDNRRALVSKVTKLAGFPQNIFIPSAAVVVLTNTSRASLVGLPDSFRFVITQEQLPNFQQNLERAMMTPEARLNPHSSGIKNKAFDFLYKYFSRLPALQAPLKSLMELDNDTIERLTVDHYLTIEQLNDEKQVVINGGAGTGKTVLAVQKAVREAQDGKKTLFLCFNRLLSEDLSARIAAYPSDVTRLIKVSNFHQFCETICAHGGVSPDKQKTSDTEYFEAVVEKALDWMEKSGDSKFKFDSIVVDEGQDFKSKWWELLQLVWSEDRNGHFWIFKDDFQNVQWGDVAHRGDFFSFRLLRNFRNSRSVFKLISGSKLNRFVEHSLPVGPGGGECNVVACMDGDDLKRKLGAALKKLTEIEKVPAEDIVILTGSTLSGDNAKSVLRGVNELGGVPITRERSETKNKVFLETVRRYKGLENKYVILVEIDAKEKDNLAENEQLVYVGASRAVSALSIYAKRETLERLGFMDEAELPRSA